ncbi:MAG: hypothetical protein R3B45_10880 [Bdellovibrionota bacterium]
MFKFKIVVFMLGSIVVSSLIFGLAITLLDDPVVFESLESKTINGDAVFNRIKFFPGWKQDIWIMQQSHNGLNSRVSDWDKLAIIVNKEKSSYIANFYQLKPGALSVNVEWQPVPFKVRCYACHANGPRAIRPNLNSKQKPSIRERIQIGILNLRIKSYGNMSSNSGKKFEQGAPFKSSHKSLNRPLKLKSCKLCHSKNGLRNKLTLEHLSTVRFLINRGEMPPYPFKIHGDEIKDLHNLTLYVKQ